MKIFYTKKDRHIREGLEIIQDGLEIKLDHIKGHMQREDLSEEAKMYWKAMYMQCLSLLSQIELVFDDDLHY